MGAIDLGMPRIGVFDEADRQLRICNSCRYCAGYCAVWPALERRRELTPEDVTHLSNLCHDCRDCYTACMYIPPHEFGVNPPEVFAKVRTETYLNFVWGARWVAGRKGWLWWTSITALAFAIVVLFSASFEEDGGVQSTAAAAGSPYGVIAHWALIGLVMIPTLFTVVVLSAAGLSYWRHINGRWRTLLSPRAWTSALARAATLRHQSGGGEGCTYPGETMNHVRPRYHHLVSYGFLLTIVSTTAAAFEQNVLGNFPPYPVISVPVLAGVIGGAMQIIGCAGLLVLKSRADRSQSTPTMLKADRAFLWALIGISVSGFLVLFTRSTNAFPLVFTVHLTSVLVAFAVAPYTKFVHWLFRLLSVYHDVLESSARGAR